MKILVIGRHGQVARALARRAAARGVQVETLGRSDLDLTQTDRIGAVLRACDPHVVINAAAYTAVDKAESERSAAFQINAIAPGAIAAGAAAVNAAMIQISTDYVYSGDKPLPYAEDDQCEPSTVYGQSKLEGEQRALDLNPRTVVVRTSWVFDELGQNFVRTMLRLAGERATLNVVADQRGCPTYACDLADALLSIAVSATGHEPKFGVYHCAGGGETTWADFASRIFALARARGGPFAEVKPISTSDYRTAARRPANSRLDCGKLARDYNLQLRPWVDALAACVDEIAAHGWRLR